MRWINKRQHSYRKKGHAIVRRFLERGWDNISGKYINCSYSDLKREGRITRLLLQEQDYHCCYCMRALSLDRRATIEHIMPRKTDVEDLATIRHYSSVCMAMKYVKCTSEPPSTRMKIPPYPHYCAYENLVASCDGSICAVDNPDADFGYIHSCCNNVRGNKLILPLFFNPNVERLLIYEQDGELTYNEELYKSTIEVVNLEHSTLKLMRKAWASISKWSKIETVERGVSDESLREEMLDNMNLNASERDFLRRKSVWNLLFEYRWFYDYFKYRRCRLRPKQ